MTSAVERGDLRPRGAALAFALGTGVSFAPFLHGHLLAALGG